ncbi:MAG: hypothetical protein PHV99_02620 [Candidatus Pacebacteria bacterium]|nr:hypothetical protein [Candidatus Paceibacterota bacterium]
MLRNSDRQWLAEHYPNLSAESDDKIFGEVIFTATYNEESGRFLQITPEVTDGVGGLCLSGSFRISIETRTVFNHSRLPALTIEGVDPVPDRHINISDGSACMCNPLEEDEYSEPYFNFQRFFGELVIPFLYGQLYFSREGRWPWFDYAHGGLGTIEAFSKNPTAEKATDCIQRISKEIVLWRIVKPLLLQEVGIKGHIMCPCPKHDYLRRCHPMALKGLRLLRETIRKHSIQLP